MNSDKINYFFSRYGNIQHLLKNFLLISFEWKSKFISFMNAFYFNIAYLKLNEHVIAYIDLIVLLLQISADWYLSLQHYTC